MMVDPQFFPVLKAKPLLEKIIQALCALYRKIDREKSWTACKGIMAGYDRAAPACQTT